MRGFVSFHWYEIEEQNIVIDVDIVHTIPDRKRGLMYVDRLPYYHGMVFLYRTEGFHGGFHMMNTFIPLSIAFISSGGEIVDIIDMEPLDETIHYPRSTYLFAIEVNRGFFQDHDIYIGDHVTLSIIE